MSTCTLIFSSRYQQPSVNESPQKQHDACKCANPCRSTRSSIFGNSNPTCEKRNFGYLIWSVVCGEKGAAPSNIVCRRPRNPSFHVCRTLGPCLTTFIGLGHSCSFTRQRERLICTLHPTRCSADSFPDFEADDCSDQLHLGDDRDLLKALAIGKHKIHVELHVSLSVQRTCHHPDPNVETPMGPCRKRPKSCRPGPDAPR